MGGVRVKMNSTTGWTQGTYTTGYWDCCKPSCSWPGKGQVNHPTLSCDVDGNKLQDANVASVCDGGTASSCADNKPFLVNSGLSMGFAAAAVGGVNGLNGVRVKMNSTTGWTQGTYTPTPAPAPASCTSQ